MDLSRRPPELSSTSPSSGFPDWPMGRPVDKPPGTDIPGQLLLHPIDINEERERAQNPLPPGLREVTDTPDSPYGEDDEQKELRCTPPWALSGNNEASEVREVKKPVTINREHVP